MAVAFYERFFGGVAYPFWEQVVRGRPTFDHLRFLERSQWLPAQDLRAVQAGELRKLLNHSYANVPFFRRRFDEAGLKPRDIHDAGDLSRLPVMDRPATIASVTERTATAGATVDVKKATSGTTGMPLTIGYNIDSDHWRKAVRLRGYRWGGYGLGKRAVHYWGFDNPLATQFKRAKLRADRFMRREIFVDCVRRGEVELEAFARLLERYRPGLIVSYSHAVADFARYVQSKDRRTWDDIPVICGAEKLLAEDRPLVEKTFGPGIFETYGCREVMLMSAECGAHAGMHVSMENVVVEIIVRDASGGERPALPGEVGEVVITDLHNYAMPLIRYVNGDLATAGPTEPCACGRGLARIAGVEGRTADTLTDGDGNRVAGLLFSMLLSSLKDIINQFQVIQHKDKSVTVKLIPGPRYEEEGRAAVQNVVQKYLRGLPVAIEEVSEIVLDPSGKRRIVRVER